ncbi:MAG: hypothetical protein HC819_23510 [Cyclobacteriaceae bacterium]|nr:hypothetical protein [Cyclobacteriaceae bacterium]
MEEEAKIGQEINYSLSVRYNRTLNILFPDSTYNFGTFEYLSHQYFNTKTDSTLSFDSVVYQLATFEIDTIQYLQLPVFVINNKDSISSLSNPDTIKLVEVIKEMPEKPEMKSNTELVHVHRQFNYPYLLIALGLFAFIVLALLLFFGRQISKAWRIHRMKKVHQKFVEQFFQLMRDVSGNNPGTSPEHVLAVWKRYLERLEKDQFLNLPPKKYSLCTAMHI